jgi:hypothetical protein
MPHSGMRVLASRQQRKGYIKRKAVSALGKSLFMRFSLITILQEDALRYIQYLAHRVSENAS